MSFEQVINKEVKKMLGWFSGCKGRRRLDSIPNGSDNKITK